MDLGGLRDRSLMDVPGDSDAQRRLAALDLACPGGTPSSCCFGAARSHPPSGFHTLTGTGPGWNNEGSGMLSRWHRSLNNRSVATVMGHDRSELRNHCFRVVHRAVGGGVPRRIHGSGDDLAVECFVVCPK